MSYGMRNTLLLFLILALLVGAGLGYSKLFINDEIQELRTSLKPMRKQLNEIEQSIRALETIRDNLDLQQARLRYYPKALFPSSDQSLIYGFMNEINPAQTEESTNLTAEKKVNREGYGILHSRMEGVGGFRNLYRFIALLEHSRPLNKINSIAFEGLTDLEQLGEARFSIDIQTYYYNEPPERDDQKHIYTVTSESAPLRYAPSEGGGVRRSLVRGATVQLLDEQPNWIQVAAGASTGWVSKIHLKSVKSISALEVREPGKSITSNPFYPLVHAVPPNEEGLVDVEKSKLIALSTGKAFLKSQNGEVVEIGIGDSVYLGRLRSVDQRQQTATFLLNRGGIYDWVTISIEQEESDK